MSDDLWLSDDDMSNWARHDLWRLKDAIMLTLGMQPNLVKGEWTRPNGEYGPSYDDIMRMAKSSNVDNKLSLHGEGKKWVCPAEFIAWAKSKKLNVNSDLERALAACCQTGEGGRPVVAPPAQEQAKSEGQGGSAGTWKEQARMIADECFDRDTANNCRDKLAGYAGRVMDEMQKRGIHGPRGRIDNPATIQRDALQGKKWWANKQR